MPVQKICVTGKGGVGKSTIASVLARDLAKKGYEVLVIDTDESNPSIYRKLGMSEEPKPLISYLERFNLDYGIPENTWLAQDDICLEDIPEEFIVKSGNIRLLEIGKIDHSLQGCACSMADLSKQLMKNLRLKENQIVIADLEAGVESFGRGIEQGADLILTVTETSYDSIRLAETILEMANDIGIEKVYTIYNRIPKSLSEETFLEKNESSDRLNALGTIKYDDDVVLSGINGEPVPADCTLYKNIVYFTEKIL